MRTAASSNGTRRSASTLRHRLVLVVLVPALGLAGFGGLALRTRSLQTERARDVEARVERAGALLRIKLAFTNENFSTGATAAAAAMGVPPTALTSVLGFDPTVRVGRDRRVTDEAVLPVADDPEAADPYALLLRIREDLDGGHAELSSLLGRFSRIQADITDSAIAALTRAEDGASELGGSTALRRDTSVLRSAVGAATAVGVELDGLGRLLTPGTTASRQDALDQLRLGAALDAESAGALDLVASTRLQRAWKATHDSDPALALRAHVERFASEALADVPALPLPQVAGIIAEGMQSLDRHVDFVDRVSTQTLVDARHLHEGAVREQRVAVGLVAVVLAAALLIAGLISRSIALPLGTLAGRARRVTGGDLGDEPTGSRGPREVRQVSTTIEELVDNLRVVESQVGALAAGALGDPVLDVPVPGRLGTLLHDSVARLSRSIAEREVLSQRLEHEATHDALTGLLNRGSFLLALRLALDRGDGRAALVKIDLDGFKPVNETHGHDAGDHLLRVTAERLHDHAGEGNPVARLGGDEFAVMLAGVGDADEAADVAARMIARVAEPVRVGAVVTQVRASAGVALAEPGVDPEHVVRHAGLAAKAAKAAGGGVTRFDAAMVAEVRRRAGVEARLRRALEQGDLVLHLQPIVDGELRTLGAEALVRWRQPDGTLLPPSEFIPTAEASDLIVDVGRWVLREACEVLARWAEDPARADLRLAVNLSARHVLSLTVVDDVRTALEAAGVAATRLEIEVTETVVLSDLAVATEHLSRLRDLGVTIAIDDFGTGFTSLAHLRLLPVDVIKIDRSLVVGAAEKAADARIVELVVGAAHANGMAVVAEGIETTAQLTVLRGAGSDRFQGYLIARPAPERWFVVQAHAEPAEAAARS